MLRKQITQFSPKSFLFLLLMLLFILFVSFFSLVLEKLEAQTPGQGDIIKSFFLAGWKLVFATWG